MFNFNKLDKYKKFMQEEGICEIVFTASCSYTLKIKENRYYLSMFKDFDDVWEIENDNWEDFKIKVANYFLEGRKR